MFLEKRAGSESGLDLTAAVLLAITNTLMHSGARERERAYMRGSGEHIRYLREIWQMPEETATLEAQLMDLCDDIAYSTHDLEDGIRAGKIQMNRSFFRR